MVKQYHNIIDMNSVRESSNRCTWELGAGCGGVWSPTRGGLIIRSPFDHSWTFPAHLQNCTNGTKTTICLSNQGRAPYLITSKQFSFSISMNNWVCIFRYNNNTYYQIILYCWRRSYIILVWSNCAPCLTTLLLLQCAFTPFVAT